MKRIPIIAFLVLAFWSCGTSRPVPEETFWKQVFERENLTDSSALILYIGEGMCAECINKELINLCECPEIARNTVSAVSRTNAISWRRSPPFRSNARYSFRRMECRISSSPLPCNRIICFMSHLPGLSSRRTIRSIARRKEPAIITAVSVPYFLSGNGPPCLPTPPGKSAVKNIGDSYKFLIPLPRYF